MYHCGAAPVLMHMADGMYGAWSSSIRRAGRPAAREYVLVQSEFYGSGGQYAKMLTGPTRLRGLQRPGAPLQSGPAPLLAKAGELVRIFIVNAGPNSSSAFHVIGALFSHYESDGYPPNAMGMHQTIDVPPGARARSSSSRLPSLEPTRS